MAKQKLTFRQRMRKDAEAGLDDLVVRVQAFAIKAVKGTSVDPALLMQLAGQPKQGKTLRHDLITKLANDKEAELEKLYNDQQKLDLGEKDD